MTLSTRRQTTVIEQAQTDEILASSMAGESLRAIAAKQGCSHEHVRSHLIRAKGRLVSQIEVDLLLAAKQEQVGLPAVWPTLLVPNADDQGDRASALSFLQWVLDALRGRGVPIKTISATTPVGVGVWGGTEQNLALRAVWPAAEGFLRVAAGG